MEQPPAAKPPPPEKRPPSPPQPPPADDFRVGIDEFDPAGADLTPAPGAAAQGVAVITDFECGLRHGVKQVAPNHFRVNFPRGRQESGFFMFVLDNITDQPVRVDLHSDRAHNWTTLNPVYAYIDPTIPIDDALADPKLFECGESPNVEIKELPKANNGVPLPPTSNRSRQLQQWQFIPDTTSGGADGKKLFTFTHAFDPNKGKRVVVSMRYPYTPKLRDAYMAALRERWNKREAGRAQPEWEVIQVGESEQGRPLWLVRIGPRTPPAKVSALAATIAETAEYQYRPIPSKKATVPTIVVYAREHADEQDGSWVAMGLIDFLLGSHPDSQAIRKHVTFLIIPMLDADGAVESVYETKVIRSFDDGPETPESLAVAGWLRDWVDKGNRLDLVINLHNVESHEGPHLFPYLQESGPRHAMIGQLHRAVCKQLVGYDVREKLGGNGSFRTRLGGWLRHYFGATHLFYEINSQAAARHLSLYELKAIGVAIARGGGAHLYSPDAAPLRSETQRFRDARYALWARYGWMQRIFPPDETVFHSEQALRVLPILEDVYAPRPSKPQWIAPMFQRYGLTGPPKDLLEVVKEH